MDEAGDEDNMQGNLSTCCLPKVCMYALPKPSIFEMLIIA